MTALSLIRLNSMYSQVNGILMFSLSIGREIVSRESMYIQRT